MVQWGGIDSTGLEARGQTRELVPGAGKGEECHEACREAGGDVGTVFCLFSLQRIKVFCSKKDGGRRLEKSDVPRAVTALMPDKSKALV